MTQNLQCEKGSKFENPKNPGIQPTNGIAVHVVLCLITATKLQFRVLSHLTHTKNYIEIVLHFTVRI